MAKKVKDMISSAKQKLEEQTAAEWETKLSKMGSGKPADTIKENEDDKEKVVKEEDDDSEEMNEASDNKEVSTDDDSDSIKEENEDEEDEKEKLEDSYRQEEQPATQTITYDVFKSLTVKEDIDTIFSGSELSEDFKKKATTVYEAALKKTISEATQEIQKHAAKLIAEQVKKIEEETENRTNEYLGYIVEEWLSENEVAIEKGIRAEIAEGFLLDFKALMESYNITMPEESANLLEEKNKEVEELKSQVNSLMEKVVEKDKTLFEMKVNETVTVLSEGLAATEAEKFKTLVKDIEASDVATFKEKAEIIKESFFSKVTKQNEKLNISEELVLNEEADEEVAKYFAAIQKINAAY
jgi:hypothetical protein